MWKDEFKRLFCSYKTIIIITVLIIFGIISFYFTYQSKLDFLDLKRTLPVDVSANNLNELLNYYKGLKFNLEFFLTSDYIQFYLITLLLFVGIFMSSELNRRISSGQENFFLCRMKYSKQINNLFIAQSLYITSIVVISTIITIFIGYVIGGFGGNKVPMGMYEITHQLGLLMIGIQMLIILVYTILANGISLFSNVFIKDKITIQVLPFVLFYIFPTIIVTYFCNIFSIDYFMIKYFIPSSMLLGIDMVIQSQAYFSLIKYYLTPIFLYLIVLIILYMINRKKLGKDTL